MSAKKKIMIIAGEISGDMHAAKLVEAIKSIRSDIDFFGIGGDKLRSAGVEIHYDVKDMAVMGFAEVIRRLWFFRRVFHEMVALAVERRPDAVILIDYPGFNLRFAAEARRLGIQVIYYICPQVWAWDRARIPKMAAAIDRLITIFPFEEQYFRKTGLKVDFVGHPLVDEAKKMSNSADIKLPWDSSSLVALLPGSRVHVIDRVFPVMWAAASLLERRFPEATFVVAAPSLAIKAFIEGRIKEMQGGPSRWVVIAGNTRQVLRQARAAMVVSGTATLEASLMLCPMVVVYKMAWLSYVLGKLLIKVSNIGMVNIMAGKTLCPEFIQGAATPAALANAIEPMIRDSANRSDIINGLKQVNAALGPGGADEKAARVVVEVLYGK